ncbi:hypothetical protein IC608_16120 [Devosia sp. PTR5]|uniref:Hint domain-containing protein n=1 Tax=Devosia oryzisoli TaxID=2774138 RepID=A0A927FXZ7_9HYPH|nr:hypothetical protein [Devosia oryzisoli]MBD8066998.1 hypothetical protein [Devosia oryzisoli]
MAEDNNGAVEGLWGDVVADFTSAYSSALGDAIRAALSEGGVSSSYILNGVRYLHNSPGYIFDAAELKDLFDRNLTAEEKFDIVGGVAGSQIGGALGASLGIPGVIVGSILGDIIGGYAGRGVYYTPGALDKIETGTTSAVDAYVRDIESGVKGILTTGGINTDIFSTGFCFAPGTQILLENGTTKSIEHVEVGDIVLSFDAESAGGAGSLVPARVSRLFENICNEFVVLDNGLTVTPHHEFLTEGGLFLPISRILASEGIVFNDKGQPCSITGRRIHYSDQTSSLFEQGVVYHSNFEGNLAQAPHIIKGWKTFNFEVEGLHTYVAGGLRVHNQSVSAANLSDALAGNGYSGLIEATLANARQQNGYDAIIDRPFGPDDAIFNAGSSSDLYREQEKVWRSDLLKQMTKADGTSQWVVQYTDANGNVITKDPQTGARIDPTKLSSGSLDPANAAPRTSYEDGSYDSLTYTRNDDGTWTNNVTGQTTSATDYVSKGSGEPLYEQTVRTYNPDTNQFEDRVVYRPAPSDSDSSSGGSGGSDSDKPILVDLDGDGIKLAELGTSNTFFDMDGDGKLNRTAWAGAGDGVLVRDGNDDGVIDQRSEVVFTDWDGTSKSDLQALLAIFDTNNNGKLDAGDTDWSLFKVLVANTDGTTTLMTLGELGITEITLISNNQSINFSDGSAIFGGSTFKRSDGSTGLVADTRLSYEEEEFVVTKTVTLNGDGSTTVVNTGSDADGSAANRTTSTTSADGNTRTTEFDDDGDGINDRVVIETRSVAGSGEVTETRLDYDGSGTILQRRQVTETSADGKTVEVSFDLSGSETRFDSVETRVTGNDGSLTVTVETLNANGSTRGETITTTSADGLSKTTQADITGDGVINASQIESTSVAGDGTRTETVTSYVGSGTSSAHRIGSTVTTVSADASDKTIEADVDGDGDVDLGTSSIIVRNLDDSTTTTVELRNNDNSLRGSATTDLSEDGLDRTVSSDLDGDGDTDSFVRDLRVIAGDGSTTRTVTTRAGNNDLLSQTIMTWSADGKTRSTSTDSDGDGQVDRTQIVAVVGTDTVETSEVYAPNGENLLSRTITTTSGDGLTRSTQLDADGNGVVDAVRRTTTLINQDGSSTKTQILRDGADTTDITRTVTQTSADGLSSTIETFNQGETSPHKTLTSVRVLNGDGSTTQTVTTYAGANLAVAAKALTQTSADRLTTTTSTYVGTNISPETVTTSATASDGSRTETVLGYSPDGSVLLGRTVTTVSTNGLVVTRKTDADGDGDFDSTEVEAKVLNADGTTQTTTTRYAGIGTTTADKIDSSVTVVSGNGLAIETERDADGDGTIDNQVTEVTVFNANGSTTRTTTNFNGDGTVQTGRLVATVSDDGLSKTSWKYLGDSTTPDIKETETTVLSADGSRTITATTRSGDDTLVRQSVTTISGDGLSATTTIDLDGDGVTDKTIETVTNADGSVTTENETFDGSTLESRSVRTVSANGLSITVETDLDGNATIDRKTTDVTTLNLDGSRSRVETHYKAGNVVEGKTTTVTSGDGLTIESTFEALGSGTTRTRNEVTSVATDGTTTRVVENRKGDGSLNDRTVSSVSGDGTMVRTTTDIDGDGNVDQTVLKVSRADGSVLTSYMDGTVVSASGRELGTAGGKYVLESADGLVRTTQFDADGNGLAESETVESSVIGTDGERVKTISRFDLSGGNATVADPSYGRSLVEQAVITTSPNGRTITSEWDRDGDGVAETSRTDETTFNSDGSTTRTTTHFSGATMVSQFAVTRSADGLTETREWDTNGDGTVDEVSVRIIVRNADGSTTETETNTTFGGAPLSQTIVTTSADGRTITLQEDPDGVGGPDRTKTTETMTLADGTTVVIVSKYDGAGTTLQERTTNTTSADGRMVTFNRDSNGDGTVDQIKDVIQHVDGSSTVEIRDFNATGGLTSRTLTAKTADGRESTAQQDIDGDFTFDLSTTHRWHDNSDGSTEETVDIYQISARASDGTVVVITPLLVQSAKVTTSADGRVQTSSVDVNGDGTFDEVTTATTRLDGSSLTVVSTSPAARNEPASASEVKWVSAVVAGATTAALTEIDAAADGINRTVRGDYDGNGSFEHEEVWTIRIDGSQRGLISDKNSSSAVVATGVITISSDGLITQLDRDSDNDGSVDYREVVTVRFDGSAVKTVATDDGSGTLSIVSVTTTHANGRSLNVIGTDADDVLVGGRWNDVLVGNGGNDTLDGGAGADYMVGGDGNDIYVIDNAGDAVVELPGGGTDLVRTSLSYTLGANVEDLTLLGDAAVSATGNELDNRLTGNDGDNSIAGADGDDVLVGGAGSDLLDGGSGFDIASYENSISAVRVHTGDIASNTGEAAGDVYCSIEGLRGSTFDDELIFIGDGARIDGGAGDDILTVVGSEAEINGEEGEDTLYGHAGNDILHGGEGDDSIHGYDGNDVLDGGTGADWMVGGDKDDTYVVDDLGDTVVEYAGGGKDTVRSSITYALGTYVENLTLIGSASVNGTGNGLANVLVGNTGANTLVASAGDDSLDGGDGVDTMVGGTGDDTYYVDNAADVVVEASGEGNDAVLTAASFTLAANVENLTLLGTSNISGTGNSLDNVINGNDGNNALSGGHGDDSIDGGVGADTMSGGAGNEIYVVDDSGDLVVEEQDEGNDTVLSSINYVLTANVENLELVGTGDINGTGNELDNFITGNTGSNTLTGAEGDDTLMGGDGNDVLVGGAGGDQLNGGTGNDTVSYADASAGIVLKFDQHSSLNGGDAQGDTFESIEIVVGSAFADLISVVGDFPTIYGGAGDDEIYGSGNENTFFGEEGDDELWGDFGADHLDGGSGSDFLFGYTGDDALIGGAGDDELYAGDGNDVLDGGVGADAFFGGNGIDAVTYQSASAAIILKLYQDPGLNTGDAHGDTFDSVEIIHASMYADIIEVDDDYMTVFGAAGDDKLVGYGASNTFYGESGDDELWGDYGADTMNGGDGDDYLYGHTGQDTMVGGAGSDELIGGGDDDDISGGSGNDTFIYTRGDGNDVIYEGAAEGSADLLQVNGVNGLTDTYLHAQGKDLLIEIYESSAGAGDGGSILIDSYLDMSGDYGVETIEDSYGNVWTKDDIFLFLYGNSSGGLTMTGTSAADTLLGTAQHDEFNGGNGNDVIEGAGGSDLLYGGSGNDTFVFASGFGQDDIGDFQAGTDMIEIRNQGSLDFAALIADAEQWGSDAILHFDDGGQITLHGVAVENLTTSDFRFV